MKNSSDTIGNPTRDLPTCSAVPQPTAPPRARIIGYATCKTAVEISRAAEGKIFADVGFMKILY